MESIETWEKALEIAKEIEADYLDINADNENFLRLTFSWDKQK